MIDQRLASMRSRIAGKHAEGTNIIPFSVHQLDELMADMKLSLGAATRFKPWLLPVDPRDFAGAAQRLLTRHAAGA